MPRTAMKNALVAAVVSTVLSLLQVAILSSVKHLEFELPAILLGAVMLYGAGLLFAAQLAIAGWVVQLPGAFHQAPWLAMTVGQPAILVGAVLIANQLGVSTSVRRAAVWLASLAALVLVVTVARRRSGRWSSGGLTWMIVASVAWAVAFGTQWLSTWWPKGDVGYVLMVGIWQVLFSSAYAWWVWPRAVPIS
jgi:hypothetical protein